jgi:hypothetical protein
LLTNGQAFIYRGGKAQPHEVFGCVPGHRSYDLGRIGGPVTQPPGATGGTLIRQLTIGGPMVAFQDVLGEKMVVRDLRTGRFVVRESHGVHGFSAVEQIVVKSDGAVAWIVRVNYGHGGNPIIWDVYAVDTSGNRLLAEGKEGLDPIDPSSLTLAGSTLYWTQNGKPFSAPLN